MLSEAKIEALKAQHCAEMHHVALQPEKGEQSGGDGLLRHPKDMLINNPKGSQENQKGFIKKS